MAVEFSGKGASISEMVKYIEYGKPSEILNLTVHISIKDDKPFVHTHIVLADETGKAYGGHLSPGTIIFACEFVITVYTGTELKRKLDNLTGLFLWKLEMNDN